VIEPLNPPIQRSTYIEHEPEAHTLYNDWQYVPQRFTSLSSHNEGFP